VDKSAFYKIGYGLYIVGANKENSLNGFISNSVFQVTASPAQFAVGCNKDNFTTEYIRSGNAFSINVLSQNSPMDLISLFGYKSGREINKFEQVHHYAGETGAPLLKDSIVANIECNLVDEINLGTHMLFIGTVVSSLVLDDNTIPLTYDYYRNVKKGSVPKNSPTFQAVEKKGKEYYHCPVCNYVYKPEDGDPKANIPSGTAFEDLPDEWLCPLCATEKKYFIT
jgi:flavin reductase (DIM6/NTAB) family NADH-FMN oxidoreductase RutF/rubredoxin